MSPSTSGKKVSEQYHEHAEPERDSAKRLADSLDPWRDIVPPGPILEVGAGTGIFTGYLKRIFPERELIVSDVSQEKLEYARAQFDENESLYYKQFNAESDDIEELHYSLICGNQIAHQFDNPAATLEKLALGLRIDGLMLMSFPGEDSFQEWRSTCLDLGIPYTGRSMPGTEPLVIHLSMGPVQVDFYEDQSTWYFEEFKEFFSHMKAGGIDIQSDERKLTDKDITLLNQHWNRTKEEKTGLTYHNVFLAIKRIGE